MGCVRVLRKKLRAMMAIAENFLAFARSSSMIPNRFNRSHKSVSKTLQEKPQISAQHLNCQKVQSFK